MDNNKSQLIDLWRTSFNDSEEFIKLFFDRVYKKENALFIEKNGKIVSDPSNASVCHDLLRKGDIRKLYIWSLHSSLRTRSGTYAPTDTEAFEVMESRKVALTVIIPADPWLFDYYRDLGYTEAFDYSEETYIRPSEIVLEQGVLVVPPEVPSMEFSLQFFK